LSFFAPPKKIAFFRRPTFFSFGDFGDFWDFENEIASFRHSLGFGQKHVFGPLFYTSATIRTEEKNFYFLKVVIFGVTKFTRIS
jgi:hypothetical protein